MALPIDKKYRHKLSQRGNYIIIEDISDLALLPLNGETKPVVFWHPHDESWVRFETTTSVIKEILATPNEEIIIHVFQAYEYDSSKSYGHDDLVIFDNKLYCVRNAPTPISEPTNPNWVRVTEFNYNTLLPSWFRKYPEITVAYFITPYSFSDADNNGDIKVTKTGDHAFMIDWFANTDITRAVLYDYKHNQIGVLDFEAKSIEVLTSEDGVYIVEMLMNDGTIHYAELYDFTDSEKCYLTLVNDVLCSCVDCNDCKGADYTRMLNYINTYQVLKDMVYTDRAVNLGIQSTDINRSEYIMTMGILLKKMSMLSDDCSCNKDEDNDR